MLTTWFLVAFINGHPVVIDHLANERACEEVRTQLQKHYGPEAMTGKCFPKRK